MTVAFEGERKIYSYLFKTFIISKQNAEIPFNLISHDFFLASHQEGLSCSLSGVGAPNL
jgi:hypothetical protein